MKQTVNDRIVPITELPKRKRNVVSNVFHVLKSAEKALRLMQEDQIEVGHAYAFVAKQEELDSHDLTLKAAARPFKKFAKAHYGDKYKVIAHNTFEGPTIFILRPAPKKSR
jgi:hypothetical protein